MKFDEIKRRAVEAYAGLSSRERWIVWLGCAIGSVILIVLIYEPIAAAFKQQTLELQQMEAKARRLPEAIKEFDRLARQKAEIEGRYKQIEFSEGVRSHLEKMIIDKAGVPTGFQIREQPTVDFGGDYRQEPYNVKLAIQSLPKLVEFLDELVNGKRPLMLTKLEVRKTTRRGGELDVDLDVSSIRRTSGESGS